MVEQFEVEVGEIVMRPIIVGWSGSCDKYQLSVKEAQELVHDINCAIDKNRTAALNRVTEKLKGSGMMPLEVKANADSTFTAIITEVHK